MSLSIASPMRFYAPLMISHFVALLQARADGGHWYARMLLALARRFVALEFFDRSLAIAAQMLVAFIPLVIGLTALVADDSAVAEEVIRRLGLTGASVEMVRLLFDTDALPDNSAGIGTLSIFFLALSHSSFRQTRSPSLRTRLRLAGVIGQERMAKCLVGAGARLPCRAGQCGTKLCL